MQKERGKKKTLNFAKHLVAFLQNGSLLTPRMNRAKAKEPKHDYEQGKEE